MKLLIVLVVLVAYCKGTPDLPATFSTQVIFPDARGQKKG